MPIDWSTFTIPKSGKPKKEPKDRVTDDLRKRVLERDGQCFLHTLYDVEHQCTGMYGVDDKHRPDDVARLTYEHVLEEPRMGKRAESDERHAVALCYGSNVRGLTKIERDAARAYLDAFYA